VVAFAGVVVSNHDGLPGFWCHLAIHADGNEDISSRSENSKMTQVRSLLGEELLWCAVSKFGGRPSINKIVCRRDGLRPQIEWNWSFKTQAPCSFSECPIHALGGSILSWSIGLGILP
jgi:hypothetical protein